MHFYEKPLLSLEKREIHDNTRKLTVYLVDRYLESINNKDKDKLSKDNLTIKSSLSDIYDILDLQEKKGIELLKESTIPSYLQYLLKKEAISNELEKICSNGLTYYEDGMLTKTYIISRFRILYEIEITLNRDFIEDILQDDSSLAMVFGSDFNKLKNTYSKRLLDSLLLHSEQNTSEKIEISLDELRKNLGIEDDKYENYADIKRRVLSPAIKALHDIGMDVKLTENKEGKKVVSVNFDID